MQISFCCHPAYSPSVISHCSQERAQFQTWSPSHTSYLGFFQFLMPHSLPPPPQPSLHPTNSFLSFNSLLMGHFCGKSSPETLISLILTPRASCASFFTALSPACYSLTSIIIWSMFISLIWLVNSICAGNVHILLSACNVTGALNMGFPGSSAGKESACNAKRPRLDFWLGRYPGEGIGYPVQYSRASLVAQMVKNPPAIWETWVQSLGWEDPWRRTWQPTPVFLPGESPWTEDPRGLQFMRLQRVGHDWATKHTAQYVLS